ncbi:MAG TPA: SMP-30/gluconolactonase/LRE family protein [Pseudomonadales bacterium]|nr:SMP-30/gluconolactonase/LRE family protein [Pseudomonadales bacterium]
MSLTPIDLSTAVVVGRGVKRPEDVAIATDGTVWLSDERSACARVEANGALTRVGKAGGAPNGINLDRRGRVVIANFGGPTDGYGPLQRLDPQTGIVETLVGAIGGRKLFGANYPLVDSKDRIWCSHSTWGPVDAAFRDLNDGLIFRYDPDGSVHVLAEGIAFANGIALDYDEHNLYVCETTGCDVLRYPIDSDGSLGEPVRHGPKLGLSQREVQHLRPLQPQVRSQLGMTDGCGFDQDGNLWVTLVMANKVIAITPAGDVVTMLADPDGRTMRNPTNVSWGGKDLRDLYIGSIATDYVVKVRSPIPGMPLVHQR